MAEVNLGEVIKRLEKIREYHKLAPVGVERLHINRGRQLMYELLKDLFGDPLINSQATYQGDWEMLFTQVGVDAVMAAITFQEEVVRNKAVDEQKRKIAMVALRFARQTTLQLKAMLLDTAAENLALKKPGEISAQGLVRRLENEFSKCPTPPEGQSPFHWQTIFEQRGVTGLQAWVDYELKLAQYQIDTFAVKEEKQDKIDFELSILKNKAAYLTQLIKHLP
jgi:hypothetical protein